MISDVSPEWRTRLQVARDPGFLAGVGAVLLMCAPVLPGLSRLVVLPAVLLAPGYALLRVLGQAAGMRSISVAVPVSLVLAVCASLVLYVSGIRLGPLSLGLLLGAVTALLVVGSYGRQLVAYPLRQDRRTPSGDRELAPKKLWPDAGNGPRIIGYVADSEHDEAAFVAEEVAWLADEGEATPGQVAVFYRTNAQSRAFEEVFIRAGLNYDIVGGDRFYERCEVRDLLAYLRLIADPEDEVSLRRVLNVPRRGIGQRTEDCVAIIARLDRTSFAATLSRPGEVPGLSPRAIRAIGVFNELVAGLRADAEAGVPVAEIATAVLQRSGYVAELEASSDLRDESRIENLSELVAVAREFDALRGNGAGPAETEEPGPAPGSLADFLEQVSLVADADQIPEGEDHGGKVTLMNLHTAKELEFPVVFLTGLEENVFPHERSVNDPRELQEERRLAYVGITRAEQRLYLTRAAARAWWGRPEHHQQSRFLTEIPGHLIEWRRDQAAASAPAAERLARRPGIRTVDPSPRQGGRHPHDDVVPTAPGDHPAATNALRAMFTRDFVYLGVSTLQLVLAAVMTPILTRRVGVGEFGQLTLAIVVAQLLGVTFNLGLPFSAQKVFAGEDGDRRSRGVLAIAAIFAVAASLVVALAAPAWGPAVGLDRVLDARLAALWAGCFALALTSLAMLRSRDKLRLAIFVAAVQSVGAQAAGVLLLYWWAPTVTSYLCGLIIGQGAAAFVGLLTLRPVWSALAAIRRYGPAFLFGLPMVPQQLSGFILGLGDRVVIRHVLGSAAVGRYSVAYNVGSLGFILLVFLGWAWMPRIYAVTDRVARSRLLASSRDMMNLLLIPVVCGLAAGAPIVLAVWVPKSFHPAELTPIVAIVATCTFPFAQFTANLRALMSEGKTGRAAVATLVAAAVNIGLNIVMVPFLGITGSAIATVLSYALCARLTRPPVSSGLQVPGAPVLLRILIGGAVAVTLAIGVLPTSPMWLAIRLVMGAGALLAFALLLRRAMAGSEISRRLVTRVD
jgi:O-antigen/teichoic acid export membrane protein